MSFPRYERYKDSGVEWLGEVPAEWEITKTKYVVQFQTGWTPPTGNADAYEGENLWANISDLGPKWIFDTAKRISDEAVGASRINLSPKGSLLFSFKLSIGQVSFAGADMYTNEAIATFLPNNKFSTEYAYYAFPQYITQNASENIYGAKLLNQELIRAATLLLPPLPEQQAIATFLDRETGKIDELVTEQERLIELLKEKRQAVISHAVTKGLNPDAPMKDSGIEWLGEVPEYWGITRLKHATSFIVDCPHETPIYSDNGEYQVVRTADLEDGRLDESKMYRVSETEYLNRIRRQSLKSGDIVYGREGERWGHAALIPSDDRFCLGQRMMQFRTKDGENPEYLMWQLNAATTYRQGEVDTVGATAPHVNVGTIRNYVLAEPPLIEQSQIAAFLRDQARLFDELISKATCAISLLKERRCALISAAVTGKIDVRC